MRRAILALLFLLASVSLSKAEIISHPSGCPHRAFCGCGASVEVFGHPVRELFLARNWFKFPRTEPASGTVAVRRGHVFVLKQHVGGSTWLVVDHNSGGRKSRLHHRSIAGYVIVNPSGTSIAMSRQKKNAVLSELQSP